MKITKSMVYAPSVESDELYLYTTNTGALYPQIQMTDRSLQRKVTKGVYDSTEAIKAWYYVATAASNMYKCEFGYTFSVTARWTVATELESYYRRFNHD